jgi:hypothetical protein
MSMLSSIMEFIRGKEEAPAASAPSPELLNLIESQQPPQPPMYEGYMPDDSNKPSAKKAWRDNTRARAIKSLLKRAEEKEDERYIKKAMEENLANEVPMLDDLPLEGKHPRRAKKITVTGEDVKETPEEKRRRQEAAWKKKQMRKP